MGNQQTHEVEHIQTTVAEAPVNRIAGGGEVHNEETDRNSLNDDSSSTKGTTEKDEELISQVKDDDDDEKASASSDKGINFTWEHFLVTHCGILRKDALLYESHLIAHRLSPEDTLIESLELIVEYGRIPFGDKLKIVKTIDRQQQSLQATKQLKIDTKKTLGLEAYNDFQVSMILELGGGTSKWHIEYGIERLEETEIMLEEIAGMSAIKGSSSAFHDGFASAKKHHGPAMTLLHALGYTSFDYTKDKSDDTLEPQTRPVSSDPLVKNILFGNIEQDSRDLDSSAMAMYS